MPDDDSLTRPCDVCGSTDVERRAFVKYRPDPNDAQARTDWADKLEDPVWGLACRECGFVLSFVDPRDNEELPDDLPDGVPASEQFRVDRALE